MIRQQRISDGGDEFISPQVHPGFDQHLQQTGTRCTVTQVQVKSTIIIQGKSFVVSFSTQVVYIPVLYLWSPGKNKCRIPNDSVADLGCLSPIPDPDFCPSRIPDPGSKNSNKREGRKKICCPTGTSFCNHKYHKIENYFIFLKWCRKKFGPIY